MMTVPLQVTDALLGLEQAGYEAYLVGGCVRDMLMGTKPHDYDITTSALPEQIKAVFKGEPIMDTGLRHGTVTVVKDGMPLEITTYRQDGEYKDSRHPSSVTFTASLDLDLSRRDFTIGAIAMSSSGRITDPYGGKRDMAKGCIRCVGQADRRFNEDALRILRALRFASVLGFHIEKETRSAIFRHKDLLLRISSERIFSELKKLLCGKNAGRVLTEYIDVLGVVIPELLPMKGFDQKNPHHLYDVLTHTARVIDSTPPTPLLRLTALFHDCGKPAAFTLDNKGTGHFYGHEEAGAEIAGNVLNRLKADNLTKSKVLTLIRFHDVRIQPSLKAVRRIMSRLSPSMFFLLMEFKRADNKGQDTVRFDRTEEYDTLLSLGRKIVEEEHCLSLSQLAVKGGDITALGIKGRQVGAVLNALLDAVIDGRLENDYNALMAYTKELTKDKEELK